jgi:branched-chain amino acid transport system substrate-binding protein
MQKQITLTQRAAMNSAGGVMNIRKLATMLALGVGLHASLVSGANAETLKIGLIAPLTGGGAPWGLAEEQATKILASEVNTKGGLEVGGKTYQVEVVAYDDQYKAADAVAAYNRLLNKDGVKYMIILSSPSTMALKENIQGDEVLALTSSGIVKSVDANDKYLVRLLSILADYVPPFVTWLKDNVPERRVVILDPNDESGWDATKISEKAFKENGFQIVDTELFERSQKDFEPMATRVMSMHADLIDLSSCPPATAGLIVRQLRELGYKGRLVKSGGPAPKDIVDGAGKEAAEGMLNLLYVDQSSEGYQRLAAAYRKAIGQDPNEMIVTFYDGANVLLHAIQKGGDVSDTTKARAAFAQVLPMPSAQGDQLLYGGKATSGVENQIMTVGYIGEIRNGVPVIVGKVTPK